MLLDALSFLVSGWLIKRTRAVEPAPAAVLVGTSVWAEIREGFRVVRTQPLLRALIAASAERISPIIALNKSDLAVPFERAGLRPMPSLQHPPCQAYYLVISRRYKA